MYLDGRFTGENCLLYVNSLNLDAYLTFEPLMHIATHIDNNSMIHNKNSREVTLVIIWNNTSEDYITFLTSTHTKVPYSE